MPPLVTSNDADASSDATAFGAILTLHDVDELARILSSVGLSAQVRESAHYSGGVYVRLVAGDVMVSLERATPTEVLLRGDAPTTPALAGTCERVSGALRDAGIAHTLEVYDGDDELWRTMNWSPGS